MEKIKEMEWDILSSPISIEINEHWAKIESVYNLPIKKDSIKKIYIKRNDDYNISLNLEVSIGGVEEEDEELPAGTFINPGKIVIDKLSNEKIYIEQCYLKSYVENTEKSSIECEIDCHHIYAKSNNESKILKEWYLNSREYLLIFDTNIIKEINYNYIEKRNNVIDCEINLPGTRQYSRNTINISYKNNSFDIVNVSNDYNPLWSKNLSIEYRAEYGYIPKEYEREKIKNLISFLLGTQLLYVGLSSYDKQMQVVEFDVKNPRVVGFDIKQICNQSFLSPIIPQEVNKHGCFKVILENLLDNYLDSYDELDFDDFFCTYWYAKNMAEDINLPMASTALEKLMKAWFKLKKSKCQGIYLDKKEYAKALEEPLNILMNNLSGNQYKERISNRISNCFQLGVNEKFEFFFSEISLKVEKQELDAITKRNKFAHGGSEKEESDYFEYRKMNKTYFVLLDKVILTLLGYKGKYIDYTMSYYPEKDIDIPIGK